MIRGAQMFRTPCIHRVGNSTDWWNGFRWRNKRAVVYGGIAAEISVETAEAVVADAHLVMVLHAGANRGSRYAEMAKNFFIEDVYMN